MLFAGAKTPLQRSRWLKKYTSNRCFLPCKRHTAAALLTRCYSSRGAVVSVVSAFRVHFLTLVSNYPISQRASTARNFVSVVSLRANTVCGARFCRFLPFLVSGGKVKTLKPKNQTICGKSLVKKSFIQIRRRFVHLKKYHYTYVFARARVRV